MTRDKNSNKNLYKGPLQLKIKSGQVSIYNHVIKVAKKKRVFT